MIMLCCYLQSLVLGALEKEEPIPDPPPPMVPAFASDKTHLEPVISDDESDDDTEAAFDDSPLCEPDPGSFYIRYLDLEYSTQRLIIAIAPRTVVQNLNKFRPLRQLITNLCGKLIEDLMVSIDANGNARFGSCKRGRWPIVLRLRKYRIGFQYSKIGNISKILNCITRSPFKLSILDVFIAPEHLFPLGQIQFESVTIQNTNVSSGLQLSDFAGMFESATNILINITNLVIESEDLIWLTAMKTNIPIIKTLELHNVSSRVDLNTVINLYLLGCSDTNGTTLTVVFQPMFDDAFEEAVQKLSEMKKSFALSKWRAVLNIRNSEGENHRI